MTAEMRDYRDPGWSRVSRTVGALLAVPATGGAKTVLPSMDSGKGFSRDWSQRPAWVVPTLHRTPQVCHRGLFPL